MALPKAPSKDLKLHYKRTFEIGLILSLFAIISAFKFFPEWEIKKIAETPPQVVIKTIDVERTVQETKIPPPPKPQPIVSDEPIDDDPVLPDVDLRYNEPTNKVPVLPKTDNTIEEAPPYVQWADVMPEIVGGAAALYEHLVYPEMAKRIGLEGLVQVEVYVDSEGNINDVELVKGIGGGCDEAVLEAMKHISFKPGMQRGRPVNVRVVVPVKFTLK